MQSFTVLSEPAPSLCAPTRIPIDPFIIWKCQSIAFWDASEPCNTHVVVLPKIDFTLVLLVYRTFIDVMETLDLVLWRRRSYIIPATSVTMSLQSHINVSPLVWSLVDFFAQLWRTQSLGDQSSAKKTSTSEYLSWAKMLPPIEGLNLSKNMVEFRNSSM